MGQTTVRSHTRRGYQVKEHARRTVGRNITDVLARDLDRLYGEQDKQVPSRSTVSADPDCPHPAWYPVRRLVLDTPYEDSPILAYCSTSCAATRKAEKGGPDEAAGPPNPV